MISLPIRLAVGALAGLAFAAPPLLAQKASYTALSTETPLALVEIASDPLLNSIRFTCAAGKAREVDFQQYEQDTALKVQKYAAELGLAITGFQDNRLRLLAERMAAQARGDRAGVLKAEALLAANNADGLKLVAARSTRPRNPGPDFRQIVAGSPHVLPDALCLAVLKEAAKRGHEGYLYSHLQPGKAVDELKRIIRAASGNESTYVNVDGATKNLSCELALDAGYVFGSKQSQPFMPEFSDASLNAIARRCYTTGGKPTPREAFAAGVRISQSDRKQ